MTVELKNRGGEENIKRLNKHKNKCVELGVLKKILFGCTFRTCFFSIQFEPYSFYEMVGKCIFDSKQTSMDADCRLFLYFSIVFFKLTGKFITRASVRLTWLKNGQHGNVREQKKKTNAVFHMLINVILF